MAVVMPEGMPDYAKAVIVCTVRYGKYTLPQHMIGRVGKAYMTDHRREEGTVFYEAVQNMHALLDDLGIRYTYDIGPARWAAMKTGLGVLRKNNFFYNEHGSWHWLETWVIDRELEYLNEPVALPPCPPQCGKCIDACPTGALTEAHTLNAAKCIPLNTYLRYDSLPPAELRPYMRGWLYGCDACQDVCPMNRGKWENGEPFHRLDELSEHMRLEDILTMPDERLNEMVVKKYWYISKRRSWIWRAAALRVMAVEYEPKYKTYIQNALGHPHESVAEMAAWAWGYIRTIHGVTE
jgi:epoxyqueuosine reductase